MIISSYSHTDNKYFYFRVTLNKDDKEYLLSSVVRIYQLKCIGATPLIFEYGNELCTENFEFQDRLFPRVYIKKGKICKGEFGIMLFMKKKRKNSLVVKIEFFENKKIVIRDAYIFNTSYETVSEDIISRDAHKYKYYFELESIIKKLIDLSSKTNLCDSCKYYPEYKKNGYCLHYHPDSKIPQY